MNPDLKPARLVRSLRDPRALEPRIRCLTTAGSLLTIIAIRSQSFGKTPKAEPAAQPYELDARFATFRNSDNRTEKTRGKSASLVGIFVSWIFSTSRYGPRHSIEQESNPCRDAVAASARRHFQRPHTSPTLLAAFGTLTPKLIEMEGITPEGASWRPSNSSRNKRPIFRQGALAD